MDFNDTPDEAAYRAKARAWLAAHAAPNTLPEVGSLSASETLRRAKTWQAAKAAAGYVGIMWPQAVGGQGGTPVQHVIFHQEEAAYRLPTGVYAIGLGMCLPTVFTHGSAEVAQRYVGPAMRGEEIWCQLFSEPSAGSDLAGIRTKAQQQPNGDWLINGQKVWTSYAHNADYGLLLTRTDPTVPKHAGLTMFFINMRDPAVQVRPIRTMVGDAQFNEVFFTDLRIPDSQRLGTPGAGWKVSLTTLMFERLAVGGKPVGSPGVDDVLALMHQLGVNPQDHADALARFYVADQGIALTRMRLMTALSRGQVPGPEASISKLVVAKNQQDMSGFAQELAGVQAIGNEEASPLFRLNQSQLWAAGLRIAGGTDEVLRNIIAERVLGLPGDVRADRDVPFNQIPQ